MAVQFQVDGESAEVLRDLTQNVSVIIAGKRLFDIAKGWGDNHPTGARVVVVTHNPPADAAKQFPRTVFVEGVEPAIERAREIAGGKDVTIASANIIQQALDLGLVDEVCISVAPVLFGEGIPYFAKLRKGDLMLEDPTVVQGKRARHLC